MSFAFVKATAFAVLISGTLLVAQHAPASARDFVESVMADLGSSSLKDASLSGTVEVTEGSIHEQGRFTAMTADNGYSLIEFRLPTASRTEVRQFNSGVLSGDWTDPKGKRHAMAQHNLTMGDSWFLPQIELIRVLHSGQSTFTYVGSETKNGRSLEHFTVALGTIWNRPEKRALDRAVPRFELYIDPQSLRPAVLTYNIHPDDDANVDIPVEIRYSNYIQMNQVWLPSHIERYLNYSRDIRMDVQSLEPNTRFSEALSK